MCLLSRSGQFNASEKLRFEIAVEGEGEALPFDLRQVFACVFPRWNSDPGQDCNSAVADKL